MNSQVCHHRFYVYTKKPKFYQYWLKGVFNSIIGSILHLKSICQPRNLCRAWTNYDLVVQIFQIGRGGTTIQGYHTGYMGCMVLYILNCSLVRFEMCYEREWGYWSYLNSCICWQLPHRKKHNGENIISWKGIFYCCHCYFKILRKSDNI